jgi:hypothetical protein
MLLMVLVPVCLVKIFPECFYAFFVDLTRHGSETFESRKGASDLSSPSYHCTAVMPDSCP